MVAVIIVAALFLFALSATGRLGPLLAVSLLAVVMLAVGVFAAQSGLEIPLVSAFRRATSAGQAVAWALIAYYLACLGAWRAAARRALRRLEQGAPGA